MNMTKAVLFPGLLTESYLCVSLVEENEIIDDSNQQI